jgi:hypothetical protein
MRLIRRSTKLAETVGDVVREHARCRGRVGQRDAVRLATGRSSVDGRERLDLFALICQKQVPGPGNPTGHGAPGPPSRARRRQRRRGSFVLHRSLPGVHARSSVHLRPTFSIQANVSDATATLLPRVAPLLPRLSCRGSNRRGRRQRSCPRSPACSWSGRPPWAGRSPARRRRSRRRRSPIACRQVRTSRPGSPGCSPRPAGHPVNRNGRRAGASRMDSLSVREGVRRDVAYEARGCDR